MSIKKFANPPANFRLVPIPEFGPNVVAPAVDFKTPLPVGSYVAMVFRITGYGRDCDGSAIAEVAQVDFAGETTGWTENCIGLYADCEVVLDHPGDLLAIAEDPVLAIADVPTQLQPSYPPVPQSAEPEPWLIECYKCSLAAHRGCYGSWPVADTLFVCSCYCRTDVSA